MNEHTVTINRGTACTRTPRRSVSVYLPVCTCGWLGTPTEDQAGAVMAGERHTARRR